MRSRKVLRHSSLMAIFLVVALCAFVVVYFSMDNSPEDLESQLNSLDGIEREKFLHAYCASTDASVRIWAYNKLRGNNNPTLWMEALTDEEREIQSIALSEIERLQPVDEEAIDPLMRMLQYDDERGRKSVALLSHLGHPAASRIWIVLATKGTTDDPLQANGHRVLRNVWGEAIDEFVRDWVGWGAVHAEKLAPHARKVLAELIREREANDDDGGLWFHVIPQKTQWQIGETIEFQCKITNIAEGKMLLAPVFEVPPRSDNDQNLPVIPHEAVVMFVIRDKSGKNAKMIEENREYDAFTGILRSLKDEEFIAIYPLNSLDFDKTYSVNLYPGEYDVYLIYRYESIGVNGVPRIGNPLAWQGVLRSNTFEIVVRGEIPPPRVESDSEIYSAIANAGLWSSLGKFLEKPHVRQRLRGNSTYFLPKIIDLYKDTDDRRHSNASSVLWDVYQEIAVPVALQFLDSPDVEIRERTLELICNLSDCPENDLVLMRDKVIDTMLKDNEIPIVSFFRPSGYLKDARMISILMGMVEGDHQWDGRAARALWDLVGDDPAWPKRQAIRADHRDHAKEWWEKSGKHKQWPVHPQHDAIIKKIEQQSKSNQE